MKYKTVNDREFETLLEKLKREHESIRFYTKFILFSVGHLTGLVVAYLLMYWQGQIP